MSRLVVGCLVAVGVAVVAVVAVVAAVYFYFSHSSKVEDERQKQVLALHYSPVAHSATLPPGGTQIILSGTHPTRGSEDGRSTVDAEDGTFFLDLDAPELTRIDISTAPSKPVVRRTIRGFTSDLQLCDDGTIRVADLPEERSKALLTVNARRSPDASRFAWVDPKRRALMLADAGGAHERVAATNIPEGSYDVYWASDSKRLFVYVYDDQTYRTETELPPVKNAIYATSVDAKTVTKVWEEPEATKYFLGPMYYVPATDALVFAHDDRLEMIDIRAKTSRVLWQPAEPDTSSGYPTLSPDGTKIGIPCNDGLYLLDAATGRELARIYADDDPKRRHINGFFFAPHDRILYFASGAEDYVGEVDYLKWTSWHVTNQYLFVINMDGTGRRQLTDHHLGLSIVDVDEH